MNCDCSSQQPRSENRLKQGVACLAVGAALLTAMPGSASALTITRNFISAGNDFGNGQIATAAPALVGGGNLSNVFNAAADWWEAAILDSHALSINFGWLDLGFPTIGLHSLTSQGGTPNRETGAIIRFDSVWGGTWFADATPNDSSEWTVFTETTSDLGGGLMNVGRQFTGATGDAAGNMDLFSVALHEIGHALGLASASLSYQAESWPDNDVDIGLPLPFNGAVIPTNNGSTPETGPTSNAHIDITTALMWTTSNFGVRTLFSAADILANCQISQFTNCDPNASVPEPSTIVLLGLGLAGLAATRRRKR